VKIWKKIGVPKRDSKKTRRRNKPIDPINPNNVGPREFKSQTEFLEETFAKIQLKRRWEIESNSDLQSGHSKSLGRMWKREFNLDLVGIVRKFILFFKTSEMRKIRRQQN